MKRENNTSRNKGGYRLDAYGKYEISLTLTRHYLTIMCFSGDRIMVASAKVR